MPPDPTAPLYSLPQDTADAVAQLLAADWPYAFGLAVVVWAILLIVRFARRGASL